MTRFNFEFGEKKATIKQWVIYSIGSAITVSLMVHFGNLLLKSKHGELFRDTICTMSRSFPDGNLGRWLSTSCRSFKDGKISSDEAKTLLGRTQQVIGLGSKFFDNDQSNTDFRAIDEVNFALEKWEQLNPRPKVNSALRNEFPQFTESELCILSQAESYSDGNAIGLRYIGLTPCEDN